MIQELKNDGSFTLIVISSAAWGLFAHGMAMFNKYSYHDDVPHFNGVGVTYELGRWFLAISGRLSSVFLEVKTTVFPHLKAYLQLPQSPL